MKIQIASDLHLEFLRNFQGEHLVSPHPDADVLVLAGDIASGTDAIDLFATWPVPVVYVAGNHEFYRADWAQVRADLRRAAAGTAIHFLDSDAVVINGVRFLGCTLWTDFRAGGVAQNLAMEIVEDSLNDYRIIRTTAGTLSARDTLDDHEVARAWLERELRQPFAGHTVVVTHHGPHERSVHPRFAGNPVNAGFVSDLSDLLPLAGLWVHGHVHDSFDYVSGDCRVVANPAGYVLNRRTARSANEFELENRSFDERLIVESGQRATNRS